MTLELPRRRRAVVLWGGRPGIDLQAASNADRHRTRMLARYADLERERRRLLARQLRVTARLGISAAQAVEQMRQAAAALDRIGRAAGRDRDLARRRRALNDRAAR